MTRKALLYTVLATVIGASAGGMATAFAAGQGGAASGQKAAAMFEKCDKNGDGSVTADEFKACHRNSAKADSKFKRLDANHDGKVTREEAQLAHAQWKGSKSAGATGSHRKGGMGMPGTGTSQ